MCLHSSVLIGSFYGAKTKLAAVTEWFSDFYFATAYVPNMRVKCLQ